MVHPDTELRFINSTIGYGVCATRFIPKGTIIWALDELDRIFSPEQYAAMKSPYAEILHKYCYVDLKGNHVLCWDHARFFNHSCNASCMNAGMSFELAIRDLHPGDELTDDYGALNLSLPFECHCGSPGCRHTVHADDIVRMAGEWDTAARGCFTKISSVEQPLWNLIKDDEKSLISRGLADPSTIPSCLANFHRK